MLRPESGLSVSTALFTAQNVAALVLLRTHLDLSMQTVGRSIDGNPLTDTDRLFTYFNYARFTSI